jgi:hypothetical protein
VEAYEQAALGLCDPVLCRSSGLMSRLWRFTASLLSVCHVAINTPKDIGTDLFFDISVFVFIHWTSNCFTVYGITSNTFML